MTTFSGDKKYFNVSSRSIDQAKVLSVVFYESIYLFPL